MKFKVWDEQEKKFAWYETYYIRNDGVLCCNDCCGEVNEAADCVKPVFSTETHDKNGVELFDGDIVKHESADYFVQGAIEYDKETASFLIAGHRGKFSLGIMPDLLEKIGTKFENPELMEE